MQEGNGNGIPLAWYLRDELDVIDPDSEDIPPWVVDWVIYVSYLSSPVLVAIYTVSAVLILISSLRYTFATTIPIEQDARNERKSCNWLPIDSLQ